MAGKTVKWSSFRCEIFSETKTPPKSLNIDDGLVQYVCTRTNTPSLSKLDHVDLILFICLFYTLTMMCKLRGRGRSLSLARNPAWNYLYHVIVTCFFCPEKSLKNESINEITKKNKTTNISRQPLWDVRNKLQVFRSPAGSFVLRTWMLGGGELWCYC